MSLRRRLLRRRYPRAGVILLYHRVASVHVDPFRLCVHPERFREQLRVLRSSCDVISLEALVAQLELGDPSPDDRPQVVVTFDDGYADNVEASQIAAEVEIPVTLFVSTGATVSGERFWWDELTAAVYDSKAATLSLEIDGRNRSFSISGEEQRSRTCLELHTLLRARDDQARRAVLAQVREGRGENGSWDLGRPLSAPELTSLAERSGVTIGAHGVTHRAFGSLHPEQQLEEATESKRFLEDLLDEPVTFFSFPFGRPRDVGGQATQAVAAGGYRAACTTVQAAVTAAADRFALPRLTVYDWPAERLLHRVRTL